MSLLTNFLKRGFLNGNGATLALVVAIASYGLAVYARPTESTTEFNAARAIADLECVGWKAGNASVRQRLIVANGDDVERGESADVTIGTQLKGLLPGASRETDLKSGNFKHIAAEGDAADRIAALMVASKTSGESTGLAVDNCRTPAQNWWFAGIDTQAGYTQNLVLTNPDATETVATLTAYTENGKTSMTEYEHIVVPANGITVVDLTRAVPGVVSAALQVRVVDGRLTANIQTDVVNGVAQVGRSFNPPVETLSTQTVIVGLRSNSVAPRLHLVSPHSDAIVSVILHTTDGTFPVNDATDMNLDAGVVKTIDLTDIIQTSKSAIEIVSDQPLLASATLISKSGGVNDYQILAGQSPILHGAVTSLPSEMKIAGFQALSLTNADVTVTALLAGEPLWQETTTLNAGEVTALELGERREKGMVVVVTTAASDVFVTVWLDAKTSRGTYTSAVSLLDPSTQTIAGVRLMLRTS